MCVYVYGKCTRADQPRQVFRQLPLLNLAERCQKFFCENISYCFILCFIDLSFPGTRSSHPPGRWSLSSCLVGFPWCFSFRHCPAGWQGGPIHARICQTAPPALSIIRLGWKHKARGRQLTFRVCINRSVNGSALARGGSALSPCAMAVALCLGARRCAVKPNPQTVTRAPGIAIVFRHLPSSSSFITIAIAAK